jgi:hypothetical protein
VVEWHESDKIVTFYYVVDEKLCLGLVALTFSSGFCCKFKVVDSECIGGLMVKRKEKKIAVSL